MLNYIDNVAENSTLDTCQLSGHPEMKPLPVDGVHNNICCINEPLWRGKTAISSILNESRRNKKKQIGLCFISFHVRMKENQFFGE